MMTARATWGRTVGDLLGADARSYADLPIADLTLDSRRAGPGVAFIAVAGTRSHGLAFAAEALARGAAIVLYEPTAEHAAAPAPSLAVPGLKARLGELAGRFYAVAQKPSIVGVTGTNGKTTVAYLLAQAMTEPGHPCAYVGTLGYGVLPSLTPHGLTTPDCLTLHRELAELGAPRVAMEVSSHALAQDRIAGLTFHTAAFTNLTRDHLDAHGDLESYGEAKRRLFRLPRLRHAVVNIDDAFGATLARTLPVGCELTSVSLRSSADLTARLRRSDLGGVELDVRGRFGALSLKSRLIGEFNAENLLVALGALLAEGYALDRAGEALAAARPAPGRMEVLGGPPAAPWVVIDYAHTPDALERVLRTLKSAGAGELWCVFGCGGERDQGKRPLMGSVAVSLADRIVLTDDNPRGEDPVAIVRDIRGGMNHANVAVIHDRGSAIQAAIARARPGDVVLIAGKGHETEQVIGGQRRSFSDLAVATEALGDAA